MNALIEQFFNFEVMQQALPYLLKGLLYTLLLSVILAPLGMITGLLLALASSNRTKAVRKGVRVYVNIFRSIPQLVLIILLFSALPLAGVHLSAFTCVIIALMLNNAAYFCEIFRAGLGAVGTGQREAAESTGLNRIDTLRYVILPQAIRNVLPDLASNTIEVVKSTSLASIVSVGELLHVASNIRSVTYNTTPLTVAAILYLLILLPAVKLSSKLESKTGKA